MRQQTLSPGSQLTACGDRTGEAVSSSPRKKDSRVRSADGKVGFTEIRRKNPLGRNSDSEQRGFWLLL